MEKVAEKRNLSDVKMRARKAYPNLTDEDLNFADGKENEMIDRVQKKIGKSREETAKWLKSLETESTKSEHTPAGDSKKEEPSHAKSAYKSEE
jgi:uncharacterized protein YjbJ (UPF0337 family)